ncbi:MAG TPA: hypothetical protein VG759_20120 [Candidatus Angelobacter sp.]|jgi:hypothetical protein|nr:hypothetical protein [Candidatus Angelobacter sp.]
MYLIPDVKAEPLTVTNYITLPDLVRLPDNYVKVMRQDPSVPHYYMAPGYYDENGNKLGELKDKVSNARVVVEFAGVTFVWGAFEELLEAGQRGDMIFHNVPGTAPITPFFSEWSPDESAPRISPTLFGLLAAQRGRNEARVVGQNLGNADLPAAAGFIISIQVDMPGIVVAPENVTKERHGRRSNRGENRR